LTAERAVIIEFIVLRFMSCCGQELH